MCLEQNSNATGMDTTPMTGRHIVLQLVQVECAANDGFAAEGSFKLGMDHTDTRGRSTEELEHLNLVECEPRFGKALLKEE